MKRLLLLAAAATVVSGATAVTGCSRDNIEAVNLANQGDLEKSSPEAAISKYEQAVKLDPSNHHILWKLAHAYHRKGDWQKDAATCAQAEKLAPTYASYFAEHGYALEQQAIVGPTAWSEAKQPLQDAISKDPNLSDAYEDLGNVELHLSDEKGALENYTKAIELNPANTSYYVPLASLYIQLLFLDQAEQVLKEGVTFLQPGDKHAFNIHTGLGQVQEAKGNLAAALAEYEVARKVCEPDKCSGPGQVLAYYNLGVAYAKSDPPRKSEAAAALGQFHKASCKGGKAANKLADQCSTAQQYATQMGTPLQ
jgi:tetratricopeptide (TPR) repeat protein